MALKKGVCSNYGECSKADVREVLELPADQDFLCPGCGRALDAEKITTTQFPLWKIIFMAAPVVVLLAAAGLWFTPAKPSQPQRPPVPPPGQPAPACDLRAMEESYKKGDCAGVVRLADACLAKAPNDATALNNIAVCLLRSDQPARAREPLERAVSLKPNDPYLRYNQGCVEARSGHRETSVEHLRKACQLGLAPATFRQDRDLASLAGYQPFEHLVNAKKCD